MNAAFSFPISIGIIAFGIWIAASTIGGSSPLSWPLMGLLTVIVGSVSLYQSNSRSQNRLAAPGVRASGRAARCLGRHLPSAEMDDRPNADA
jgi:hypothetical protein